MREGWTCAEGDCRTKSSLFPSLWEDLKGPKERPQLKATKELLNDAAWSRNAALLQCVVTVGLCWMGCGGVFCAVLFRAAAYWLYKVCSCHQISWLSVQPLSSSVPIIHFPLSPSGLYTALWVDPGRSGIPGWWKVVSGSESQYHCLLVLSTVHYLGRDVATEVQALHNLKEMLLIIFQQTCQASLFWAFILFSLCFVVCQKGFSKLALFLYFCLEPFSALPFLGD